MMGNVLLLPDNQHRVHDGVHGQVPLPPDEPRGRVVHPAKCGDPESGGMDAQFEFLAVAALEDVQLQSHTSGKATTVPR